MLVHVQIPGMSINLQDPLLRLTGIHPRQTGGPLTYKLSLFGLAKSHSAGKQSRKAGEHSVARAQLRRCQGSRIDDYSFVLSGVAGTPRMDSLHIANLTFFTQFYLFVKGLLSI